MIRSTYGKKISVGLIIALVTTMCLSPNANAAEEFSGSVDTVLDLTPIKSASIMSFTYDGDGVFTAAAVTSTGKEELSYMLQIGAFQGSYYQKAPSKPIVALSVKGEGDWTVKISPLKSAPVMSAKSGSGTGTQVISIGKATTSLKRITWSHDGEGVFAVTPINAKGVASFPLFLKIGPYNGTVLLQSGAQYFEVKADGKWSYSIK
jgi:hypothetical protein